MNDYDIAVLGGGLAGMSLLYHLERAGKLSGKRVLLVEPAGKKTAHDRTWSFWESGEGPFEHLLHYRWSQVSLHNDRNHCTCDLRPYAYKVIFSDAWYAYVNEVIDGVTGLVRSEQRATEPTTSSGHASFKLGDRMVTATTVFSSLPHPVDHRQIRQPYLDQHFRGWFIDTEEDVFNPGKATLMDFRTPQEGETRFFYVLPFSKRRAMIEIAIFSNEHLPQETYDRLIAEYIAAHWTNKPYRVYHTEAGNIPMTTYDYPRRNGNLIYIGLGGGAARPSTGYTFYGLQRQLMRLAADFPDLKDTGVWPEKHRLYDATLLRILEQGRLRGDRVFVDLFSNNPPARVLAFLNGESSLWQDLRLMGTTPITVFGKTFVEELLHQV